MLTISVIVPMYNVELFISSCIESLINQTFKQIEIIIVNDGSTDNSFNIAKRYESLDTRIRLYSKKNGGLSSARNFGLTKAVGDFVSFIDSDDYVELDFLDKLLSAAVAYESSIAMCGRFEKYDDRLDGRFYFNKEIKWSSEDAISRILTWDGIDSSVCDKLFRRELFHNISFPDGKYNEDIFIMIKLLHTANGIVHIGDCKYVYRQHSQSITKESFSERKLDLIEAVENVNSFVLKNYPHLSSKSRAFMLNNLIYLAGLLSKKDTFMKFSEPQGRLTFTLRKNVFSVILSQYISIQTKVKAILIILAIYRYFK